MAHHAEQTRSAPQAPASAILQSHAQARGYTAAQDLRCSYARSQGHAMYGRQSTRHAEPMRNAQAQHALATLATSTATARGTMAAR